MTNKLEDKRIFKMLISNAFLRAGRLIFQLFLNIYIWKQTGGDVKVLALFNLIYLGVHTISFISFARIVKYHTKRNLIHIISMIGYVFVYLFVIFLGELSIDYIFFIATLIGFFNGMYWINYHNNYFEVTNFRNRGNFEGLKKTLAILVSILIPSIVGSIIGINYLGLGYEIAFGFGALFFLLAGIIGVIKIDFRDKEDFYFLDTFKKCIKDKDIFRSLYTYSLTGFSFSNTLLEVIIPIILFSYIGKEMELGFLVSFFSIISMIGAYIFGKFVPYSKYRISIIISGLLYAISLLGFISFSSLNYMIFFSAIFNFFLIFFTMPQKVISDNVLHKLKNYKNRRSEYMVVRELFLSFGWIANFTIIYFIGSLNLESIKYLFYTMIFFTLISIFMLSKVDLGKIEKV